MLLCLLNDRRQVSTSTIFHKNVQHACVAINEAVVILHDMRMIQIFQNVAGGVLGQGFFLNTGDEDEHFCDNLPAITFVHAFEIDFFSS